jgi:hypothetical protein
MEAQTLLKNMICVRGERGPISFGVFIGQVNEWAVYSFSILVSGTVALVALF